MPHQAEIYDIAFEIDPETGLLAYSEVVVIGPRQGTGKALDVDTPVWTERGWLPIGQVRVGDRLAHPDGHFTDVVFTSAVMIGHDCYRVTTLDGRQVIADADHLWRVRDTYCGGARPWRTMSTRQVAAAGLRNRGDSGGWRFRLPIQRAVKTPDVPLPVDPYVLGMWLGDGTSASSSLTVGEEDLAHVTAQVHASGLVVKSLKRDRRTGAWAVWMSTPPDVDRSANRLLADLGVIRNKHVPAAYLAAGYGQRLALLQGLMDTDGCVSENHGSSPRCEFTSTRRPLAEAVLFLARSLGWRATLGAGRATLAGRDCGPRWRVAFTATLDDPPPFRLPRKADTIRAAMPRTGQRTAVSIIAIEPVESRPVRCIKVAAADGLFLAGRDLVATHNTEMTLPVMTHRCLGFDDVLARWSQETFGLRGVPRPGPQQVMYTAQTADVARRKWRDFHLKRLLRSPYRHDFECRLRLNAEAMMWRNGSMWSPSSTTGKTAGTSETIDLGVIDEAWSRPDNRTELGMRPAMMTRPWRQLWVLSMIPGLSRAQPGTWPYLRHKRQVGRARVDAGVNRGMAFFDFSAPDGLDPGDPQTWWLAIPGLGRTVTEKVVGEDFEATDLVDFCAEYLGWEPKVSAAQWTLVRRPTWTALQDPYSSVGGPFALGVEMAEDRSAAWIGVAGRRLDGHWHVEMVEPGFRVPADVVGVDWVEARTAEIAQRSDEGDVGRPCTVVIDPSRPASSLVVPLRRRGIDVLTPNGRDIAGACGRFYDATGEEATPDTDDGVRVYHLGQPELDADVAVARKLDVGAGAFTFVKKGSGSALCRLYSVILAMHGVEVKGVAAPEPDIF